MECAVALLLLLLLVGLMVVVIMVIMVIGMIVVGQHNCRLLLLAQVVGMRVVTVVGVSLGEFAASARKRRRAENVCARSDAVWPTRTT